LPHRRPLNSGMVPLRLPTTSTRVREGYVNSREEWDGLESMEKLVVQEVALYYSASGGLPVPTKRHADGASALSAGTLFARFQHF
jgi:hypothetical protein